MQKIPKRITTRFRRLMPLLLALVLAAGTVTVVAGPASAGTDTYPTSIAGCKVPSTGAIVTCDLKDSAQDTYFDPWGEYNRECTSYAAWMLHSVNGFDMPFNADAMYWKADAQNDGYTVNNTPAYGSVGWVPNGDHVVWVEGVNADGTVNVEDYNSDYTGHYAEHLNVAASTYQYIHFKDLSGSGAFRAAFQAAGSNELYMFDSVGGTMPTTQGMMPGTSPSIAGLSSGGYEEAFQANNGNLIVVGDDGNVNTGQGMMAGTSPSIAASPNGGFRVAFQANNGYLYTYDSSSGPADVGWGMMAGTSPSIAALANGYYEIALEANTGTLWLNGPVTNGNTGLGLASGTSPSIAGLSSGYNYQVAFQANGLNVLYLYTHTVSGDTAGPTTQGMASGTSPSIAALSSNNFEAAFQANSGNLFIYGSSTGTALDTQQGMASGTSPSVG